MPDELEHVAEQRAASLIAELTAARAEIADLKRALVEMCDIYFSNRAEKMLVKAIRRHAVDSDHPFALVEVDRTLETLEAEPPRRSPRGTRG